MSITWRPATMADLPGLVALFAAKAAVDHPAYVESEEEIAEEFEATWFDPAQDSLVAIDDATGRVLAYGIAELLPGAVTLSRVLLMGGVHPIARRQGLGTRLLDWQLGRARAIHAANDGHGLPKWVLAYADSGNVDAIRLFETAGMPAVRWFATMERDLAEPIPEVPLPAGLRFVPYDDGWKERLRAANGEAFLDHWGSQPISPERWDHRMAHPGNRSALSILAVTEDDEIAGFTITEVNESDIELLGRPHSYISSVGTVRAWRGRKVAPALLGAVLRASRDAGLASVVLDVDSASPTGADRLYTGMGFRADGTGQQAQLLELE